MFLSKRLTSLSSYQIFYYLLNTLTKSRSNFSKLNVSIRILIESF